MLLIATLVISIE